jgi:CHAD domain-containing protein
MSKKCSFATDQAREHVQERVRVLRSHISAARAQDMEGIHQLRVSSRRLRAALSEHRPALRRDALQAVQVIARDVTQGLGRARELDVMTVLLKMHREPLKGVARLAVNEMLQCLRLLRDQRSVDVVQAVARANSPDLDQALLDAFAALHAPPKCYLKHVRQRLVKRWEGLCELYDSWRHDPSDELLHDVRKAAKKFRYSCELSQEVYPEELNQFMGDLKTIQQDLGNWNDYRLLRDELHACASQVSRRAAAGITVLEELLQQEISGHQGRFQVHAEHFFQSENRKEAAAVLAGPDGTCCREH